MNATTDRADRSMKLLRVGVLDVAARLDRAADAKAAALVTGGQQPSGASVVYELRQVANELRQLVGDATQQQPPTAHKDGAST